MEGAIGPRPPLSALAAASTPATVATKLAQLAEAVSDAGPVGDTSLPALEELDVDDEPATAPGSLEASGVNGALAGEAILPKPPPPPRRPAPPVPHELREDAEKKPLRRPWWEELFLEDFGRAEFHLTDEQLRKEADFVEESLGVAAHGVILDLCCGAGHQAVELSRRGYSVVGYDLSLYQLALAADVAQEHNQKMNFLQGDVREMAFEEMFDGIYCWNMSFGYFEEEKNYSVAQRIFRALKPGGSFLIDVVNRDFVARHSPSQVWYEGDSCVCMDDMSLDFITSRLRVKRSIIFDDGRQKECSYSIRLYSLHELGKLLHDVGFRVTEASGHFKTPNVFLGAYSPRIIMLAQRP